MEEKEFESHKEIKDTIRNLVEGNFCDQEHARESLDSIIVDLISLREALPSIEAYMKSDLL
jgi:tRNA A58 N-methylase Trm61